MDAGAGEGRQKGRVGGVCGRSGKCKEGEGGLKVRLGQAFDARRLLSCFGNGIGMRQE